jgi:hypothetical protein
VKEGDSVHEKRHTRPDYKKSPLVSNASTPEFPFKLCSWEQSPMSNASSVNFELDINVVEERLAFATLLQEAEKGDH